MTLPQAMFENHDKAAHAVLSYLTQLQPSPQRFTLRPYDFHRPEFTAWWFVPSTDWPAYRYSKLFIDQYPPPKLEREYFFTGFYVERGLGEELGGLPDVHHKHIMQTDWYWHEFVRHVENGEIEETLQQVLEYSQCPVCVSMAVYEFNHVPEPDTDRQAPYDRLAFSIPSHDVRFQLLQPGTKILEQFNTSNNLREMMQHLEVLKDLHYFWIDLLIGVRLRYSTGTTGTWGRDKIWHNALEPWNPWIR